MLQIRAGRRSAALLLGCALVALCAACGGGDGLPLTTGRSATVFGGTVSTWARLHHGVVQEAGATVPLTTVINAPAAARQDHGGGTGPAGAWCVLPFPDAVRETTFLDHFQLHWNPAGHPPDRYAAPHFDFHAYGIAEAQVRAIGPTDTNVPAADRFPAGYTSPASVEEYQAQIVPEMGFHSLDLSELTSPTPFGATMVLGYYGGSLIFVEPMVTADRLLARESFTLAIPRPPVLGRTTLYPTRCEARFNASQQLYDFVFTAFEAAS